MPQPARNGIEPPRQPLGPNRRHVVQGLSAGMAALLAQPWTAAWMNPLAQAAEGQLSIAPFRFDVTPPLGHSCCGGWITPVKQIDDALEAIGFVLLGAGQPIVICAVDWTGILNSGHLAWRQALAKAAGTTPDRVAVQCVHQHNAPMACPDTQRLLDAQGDLPAVIDMAFFQRCLEQGGEAVRQALTRPRRCTHVANGQAQVLQIASNRRFLNAAGKIEHWRGSATKDPVLRDLPEGLIDPWLKTVAFYEDDQPIVACHYYASHPMSFYGDGRVTSDFVGLARKRFQTDQPAVTQIYFTGCAGNVAPGKYNDGTPEARKQLTDRLYDALIASWKSLAKSPIRTTTWATADLSLVAHEKLNLEQIRRQVADKTAAVVARNRPAYSLAFAERCARSQPIVLSALHVNDNVLLHLPAESFVEYQLHAQQLARGKFVATAAYGDGGPWYIPTADAFSQGGYEVGVAFSSPQTDAALRGNVRRVV